MENKNINGNSKDALQRRETQIQSGKYNEYEAARLKVRADTFVSTREYTPEEMVERAKKIIALKEETENAIKKTIKNKASSSILKSLVSKKKKRFCYDAFDLDLTYITTRIIAMGMPSTSLEGIYRNKMEDVQKFFVSRHNKHYKVYNLCEEKKYAPETFYLQAYYPFKDHEAPPINLIKPFCEDAKKFLEEDPENVLAIHCKAGKGRTGTFICCLLLYLKTFETADDALTYYGLMRVNKGKGVTIPSQVRYVYYFESILNNNLPHPITPKPRRIRRIRMVTVPMFSKTYTPSFTIENDALKYNYSDYFQRKESYANDCPYIDFHLGAAGLLVSGDVKVTFFKVGMMGGKDKIFSFWFDTNFLPEGKELELKKEEIDKVCKDREHKDYKKEFGINIYFLEE